MDEKYYTYINKTSYLSKFGYVIKKEGLDDSSLLFLKNELTARPLVDDKYGKVGSSNFPVYIETKNKLYIPKMYGINKFGLQKTSKEYDGKEWGDGNEGGEDSNIITFKGTLFNSQQEPVDALYNALVTKGGGILALGTGGGKSVIALYTLSKLKRKTLIVVNKITLMKQWENEIHAFLPNARVGIIQGQKNVNVADTDIVIGMLQSLSKIDYPQELFNDISVVVLDEAHNICSKSFSKIFFKICSKYTIGLSATPQRSDGCENLLQWHIGDVVYSKASESKSAGLPPIIKTIVINSSDYKEVKVTNSFTNEEQIQFTSMLSELINMPKRNKLIIEIIKDCITTQKRKVLLLTDRRSHVTLLKELLDKDTSVTFTYGLFIGAMKIADLEKSKCCDLILATYKAFSEGVSEASLNTLILVTPKKFIGHLQKTKKTNSKKDNGQLNQIVGRIFRKTHTELNPTIIDLQDNFSVYRNQSKQRSVFYKQHFSNGIFVNGNITLDDCNLNSINVGNIKIRRGASSPHDEQTDIPLHFDQCMIAG